MVLYQNLTAMQISLIPALSDNYIFLITQNGQAIVIDPAEAETVLRVLADQKLHLHAILNTHHHSDHTGGNLEIKEQTECHIIAPDNRRISHVDELAHEGKDIRINHIDIQVISVPGHTINHVAYYFPAQEWVFTGDCLFAAGCGRLFEGTPEQMLHSLTKLSRLPDQTKVYCGHEYTQKNLEFAHSIEPENEEVVKRLEKVKAIRAENRTTLPSTIAEEKLTNPFLRGNSPALKRALKMEDASEVEVFTKIRSLKDAF